MSMEFPPKDRQPFKDSHKQVVAQTLILINAAFALVAALAWNEAIKAFIDQYFKAGSGLYSRFVYALAVTIFAVLVTTRLTNLSERFNPAESPDRDKTAVN